MNNFIDKSVMHGVRISFSGESNPINSGYNPIDRINRAGSALKVGTVLGEATKNLTRSEFEFRNRMLRDPSWLKKRYQLVYDGADLASIDSVFENFWRKIFQKQVNLN